jgi:ankyrin repeat protein
MTDLLSKCNISLNSVEHDKVLAVTSLLRDRRVDPTIEENKAVILACEKGNSEIVKLLLQGTLSSVYRSNWILSQDLKLTLLADRRIDPYDHFNKAFVLACQNGHVEVVQILLQDKRVDPSARSSWAVQVASQNGHTNIVALLLQDPRVNPSGNENYAIQAACMNGHKDIVGLLLQDARVVPPADAFDFACERGHNEVVEILLKDKRIDPAAENNYAFKCASQNGHKEVMKLILQGTFILYCRFYCNTVVGSFKSLLRCCNRIYNTYGHATN